MPHNVSSWIDEVECFCKVKHKGLKCTQNKLFFRFHADFTLLSEENQAQHVLLRTPFVLNPLDEHRFQTIFQSFLFVKYGAIILQNTLCVAHHSRRNKCS